MRRQHERGSKARQTQKARLGDGSQVSPDAERELIVRFDKICILKTGAKL